MTGDFAEQFAELALALHDQPTVSDTVERVLDHAVKAVRCDYAGVLFVHQHRRFETVASTHPIVPELDLLQFDCGEGPDLPMRSDAFSVLVSDTRSDDRWPRWAARVAERGVRSLLGTRIHTSATTIGSLNLYDTRPEHFTEFDREVTHVLARHAAVALDSAQESANLWQAIDARTMVGQAQGILMERFGIDADQAFAVLRRFSQDNNIKLNVVASQLVSTRRLPGLDAMDGPGSRPSRRGRRAGRRGGRGGLPGRGGPRWPPPRAARPGRSRR